MSPFFSSERDLSLGQSCTLPSSLNDSGDESEILLPTPRPYSDIAVPTISATLPIARKPVRANAMLALPAARVQMASRTGDRGSALPGPLFTGSRLGPPISSSPPPPPPPPPPPKSRLRYSQPGTSPPGLETAKHSTPSTSMSNRRFLVKDVSKFMGVDIGVSPCSDYSSPLDTLEEAASDASSVYSQDDHPIEPNSHYDRQRFSWQYESEREEAPELESDIEGVSSQHSSWAKRSSPLPTIRRARMSMPPLTTSDTPVSHPLQRKDRTHRRSRDFFTLDSYHQFVAGLATPTGTSSPELAPTPPSGSSGPQSGYVSSPPETSNPYKGISGLPSDFATMCAHPREAPLPPPEKRQGSYFDFDSSSDEDESGATNSSSSSSPSRRSRDRDSFLGSFLRFSNSEGHRRTESTSATPSPTAASHFTSSRQVSSESERSLPVESKKRHSHLKSLVGGWSRHGRAAEEERRAQMRREELKARISVQGGHRL